MVLTDLPYFENAMQISTLVRVEEPYHLKYFEAIELAIASIKRSQVPQPIT